jgi:hypothetical protein
MKADNLTIYHVKSHLQVCYLSLLLDIIINYSISDRVNLIFQKYRTARYRPELSEGLSFSNSHRSFSCVFVRCSFLRVYCIHKFEISRSSEKKVTSKEEIPSIDLKG